MDNPLVYINLSTILVYIITFKNKNAFFSWMLSLLVLLLVLQTPLDPDISEDLPVLDYPQIYINPYFWIFPLENPSKPGPVLPSRVIVPDSQVVEDACADLERVFPAYSF